MAEARGEIEKEDGVLVIKRIKVHYHLRAPGKARATVERVHEMHQRFCPVYRSLAGCIDMTTEVTLEEDHASGATTG